MDLAPYAEQLGLALYDTELVREGDHLIYRVYITKPGGVTLDDCEEFSRLISPLLDANEPTSDEYFLEVSSPGIERPLRTNAHFAASIGELIKLKIRDEESKIYELLACAQDSIIVREKLLPSKPGAKVSESRQAAMPEITVALSSITRARTYIHW